jgi:hypothetical protein
VLKKIIKREAYEKYYVIFWNQEEVSFPLLNYAGLAMTILSLAIFANIKTNLPTNLDTEVYTAMVSCLSNCFN